MNGLSQMHEKVHGQWEKTLFTQHFHSLTESIDLTKPTHNHGWPSTQPNRITHNLAAHHRATDNPAARWCVGSVVCNLLTQQCRLAQRWHNVGTIVPTLGQR